MKTTDRKGSYYAHQVRGGELPIACEFSCGKLLTEFGSHRDQAVIHHRDEDQTNNLRENLAIICSDCHRRHHRHGTYTREWMNVTTTTNHAEVARWLGISRQAVAKLAKNRERTGFPQPPYDREQVTAWYKEFDPRRGPRKGIRAES